MPWFRDVPVVVFFFALGLVLLLAAGAASRIPLELLRRNRPTAVGYTHYIRGLFTGRATVGGRQVY